MPKHMHEDLLLSKQPVVLLEKLYVTPDTRVLWNGTEVKSDPDIHDIDLHASRKHRRSIECAFCTFKHARKLYVLTHEVLIHRNFLIAGLNDAEQREFILQRYTHSLSYTYLCRLCHSKLPLDKRESHFKHHISYGQYRCETCTFSDNLDIHRHQQICLAKSVCTDSLGAIRFVSRYDKCHPIKRTKLEHHGSPATRFNKTRSPASLFQDGQVQERNGLSHSADLSNIQMPANDVNHECDYCSFAHTNYLFVLTHEILRHKQQLNEELDGLKSIANEERTMMCEVLQKKFTPNLTCMLCDIVSLYRLDSLFIFHIRGHINNYPMKCRFCTYSHPAEIHEHELVHLKHPGYEKFLRAVEFVRRDGVDSGSVVTDEAANPLPGKLSEKKPCLFDSEHTATPANFQACRNEPSFGTFQCTFCEFRHKQELFTLSHEVLSHGKRINDLLQKPDPFTLHSSRYIQWGGAAFFCKLCGCKLVGNSIFKGGSGKHFFSHIKKKAPPCTYCTYSPENGQHRKMHLLQFQGVRDFFLAAKNFEGGITNSLNGQAGGVRERVESTGTNTLQTSLETTTTDAVTEESDVREICSHCSFKHPDHIYTLTHEVIAHSALVEKEISDYKSNKSRLLSRYFSALLTRSDVFTCFLCGLDVLENVFNRHLECHLYFNIDSGINCTSCTFSSKQANILHSHIQCHDVRNNASRLRLARDFVLSNITPTAGHQQDNQIITNTEFCEGNTRNGAFVGSRTSDVHNISEQQLLLISGRDVVIKDEVISDQDVEVSEPVSGASQEGHSQQSTTHQPDNDRLCNAEFCNTSQGLNSQPNGDPTCYGAQKVAASESTHIGTNSLTTRTMSPCESTPMPMNDAMHTGTTTFQVIKPPSTSDTFCNSSGYANTPQHTLTLAGPPLSTTIITPTVMECPFCAFLCNERSSMIQHVLSHSRDP